MSWKTGTTGQETEVYCSLKSAGVVSLFILQMCNCNNMSLKFQIELVRVTGNN